MAREFYSPLLPKNFSFYNAFEKIERHDNPFDPTENTEISTEILQDKELQEFVNKVSGNDDFIEEEDYDMEEYQKLSIGDLSRKIDVSFGKIKNLIDMIEKDGYKQFDREDEKVSLDEADCKILENLLTEKDKFEGSWKELLNIYFKGEK